MAGCLPVPPSSTVAEAGIADGHNRSQRPNRDATEEGAVRLCERSRVRHQSKEQPSHANPTDDQGHRPGSAAGGHRERRPAGHHPWLAWAGYRGTRNDHRPGGLPALDLALATPLGRHRRGSLSPMPGDDSSPRRQHHPSHQHRGPARAGLAVAGARRPAARKPLRRRCQPRPAIARQPTILTIIALAKRVVRICADQARPSGSGSKRVGDPGAWSSQQTECSDSWPCVRRALWRYAAGTTCSRSIRLQAPP